MSANDAPHTFCQWHIPAPADQEAGRLRFRSKQLPHYATCTSPDRGAHAASSTVKRRRGRPAFSSDMSRSLKDFLVDASLILHRIEHLLNAHYWAGCGRRGGGDEELRAARVQNVKPEHRRWLWCVANIASEYMYELTLFLNGNIVNLAFWIAFIRGSFFATRYS